MTDRPVELDRHRDVVARRSVEIRRRLRAVQAEQVSPREYQREFEELLLATLAKVQPEASAKAQYLMQLLAARPFARDRRREQLIAETLDDLRRLCAGVKARS